MAKFLWTQKHDFGPKPRYGHAMAYDSQRKRVVLFGGDSLSSGLFNDTWEWDGENWTQMTNLGPRPRSMFAMAYDSARQRTVLFGGQPVFNADDGQLRTSQLLGDTWEWDGEDWTQVEDRGPAPRRGQTMAFDSRRNRVVLYGGESAEGLAADTWEWDGEQWTQQGESGPPAGKTLTLAYESNRDRVILFGGRRNNPAARETWGWDGAVWTQVSDIGPDPCLHTAMVFALDRVVLFGGAAFVDEPPAPAVFGTTWEWDGKHWTQRQDFGPAPRWGHTMVYDSARQRLVLFGGLAVFDPNAGPALADRLLGDTWEHTVTPAGDEPDQPGVLAALILDPATLTLPGVVGEGLEPLRVACTVRLNGLFDITQNGSLIAHFPNPGVRQFSIPAGTLETVLNLPVPATTPPGTYRIEAVLDEDTLSANLTIDVAP